MGRNKDRTGDDRRRMVLDECQKHVLGAKMTTPQGIVRAPPAASWEPFRERFTEPEPSQCRSSASHSQLEHVRIQYTTVEHEDNIYKGGSSSCIPGPLYTLQQQFAAMPSALAC